MAALESEAAILFLGPAQQFLDLELSHIVLIWIQIVWFHFEKTVRTKCPRYGQSHVKEPKEVSTVMALIQGNCSLVRADCECALL